MTNDYHETNLFGEKAQKPKPKKHKKVHGVIAWEFFKQRRQRQFPREDSKKTWEAYKEYLESRNAKSPEI